MYGISCSRDRAHQLPLLAQSSTVQILGAEKALFRALKTRGNTPKYGLIFHSTFIGRAKQRNKGRISRYLANKCSIASRIDCFMDVATAAFGERMKEQVGPQLKRVGGAVLGITHIAAQSLLEPSELEQSSATYTNHLWHGHRSAH